MSAVQWGYLSDRFGRRPVLLIGPLGLSISMLLFGLSTTFWPLVVLRCLQGSFNGNIGLLNSFYCIKSRSLVNHSGVSKTVIAEVCLSKGSNQIFLTCSQITDQTNIGDAYAFIPIMWSSGTSIAYISSGFLI